jgi:hypothetical protein
LREKREATMAVTKYNLTYGNELNEMNEKLFNNEITLEEWNDFMSEALDDTTMDGVNFSSMVFNSDGKQFLSHQTNAAGLRYSDNSNYYTYDEYINKFNKKPEYTGFY